MKKNILFALFFFLNLILILNLTSCSTTDPKLEPELLLKLEDVSCTEAWLQLTTNNIQLPTTINLLKNTTVAQTFSLGTKDSLLYIDSLLPNQTYSFQASSIQNPVSSNKVTATTLDTTSHNVTFQTFTFGDIGAGGSLLYDVAIIDENNIWAVGEIYMNDSLGNPDPKIYNATHWNGSGWELKRIPILLNGTPFYPVIKSIFAFNENDIWFEAGIHWDGITFKQIPFNIQWNGNVNKLWGSSRNDLYAVGNNGNIAHYNGSSWARIESGTTTNINDVWGIFENGTSTVYCPVSSIFNPPQDKKILKITNSNVDSLSWNKDRILYSCWTTSNNYLYVCGSGVYQNKSGQWLQENVPSVSMNMVRGNAANDIFIIGDFGTALHFNGMRWQNYNEDFGDLFGLTFKQNIVAFVGQKNGFGAITIGYKN